jgi:hypothetical protein
MGEGNGRKDQSRGQIKQMVVKDRGETLKSIELVTGCGDGGILGVHGYSRIWQRRVAVFV